jgi:hypothetical protein
MLFRLTIVLLSVAMLTSCKSTPVQSEAPTRQVATASHNFDVEDFSKVAIHTIVYSRADRELVALISDGNKLGYLVTCNTPRFESNADLKLGMVFGCSKSSNHIFLATDDSIERINKYFPSILEERFLSEQVTRNNTAKANYQQPSGFSQFVLGSFSMVSALFLQESLVNYKGSGLKGKIARGARAGGVVLAIGLGIHFFGAYVNNEWLESYKDIPIVPLDRKIVTHLTELAKDRGLNETQRLEVNSALPRANELESALYLLFREALARAIIQSTQA